MSGATLAAMLGGGPKSIQSFVVDSNYWSSGTGEASIYKDTTISSVTPAKCMVLINYQHGFDNNAMGVTWSFPSGTSFRLMAQSGRQPFYTKVQIIEYY